MDHFPPEQQKKAIVKRVEADLGSMLEDLIVGAWLVYGLTRNEPESEPHRMAAGIIGTYKLHEMGWSKSEFIPSRLVLEGHDETLDERITAYVASANKHKDDLRRDLIFMIGMVFLKGRDNPTESMSLWATNAMERHRLNEDIFLQTGQGPIFLSNDSKIVQ